MVRPESKSPRPRRKMQAVTMSDVAEMAQVSLSTVSLFLRKPEAVSLKAGQAIRHAIGKLNYVPNLMARGLAAASSRAVSILVPSVRNAFFAETVSSLQMALKKQRLQLILGHTEYDEREEENLVRMALAWRPIAIILTGLKHSASTRHLLENSDIPVIEIWELGAEQIDVAIGFHHHKVGIQAAEHLIATGRRNLVFLGSRMHQDSRAKQRCHGFLQAAHAAQLSVKVVEHGDIASAEIGAMLLEEAVKLYPDMDGIACSNDHIALGALFACERLKIAVPDALAVIGFGDLSFSAACNPPLTTIRPSGDLIGREAARLIEAHLNGEVHDKQLTIDTRFTLQHRRSS